MSYKSAMNEPIPKYWKVTVNKNGGRRFTTTGFIGVVAMSLPNAVEVIQKEKPGAIIVFINHEGPVNMVSKNAPMMNFLTSTSA